MTELLQASGSFRLNSPQVAHQTLEGETILIHFETGHYFSTNRSAAAVLEALDRGRTPTQIGETWAAEGSIAGEQTRAWVDALLVQLLADGLIVPAHAAPAPLAVRGDASLPTPLSFGADAPLVEKYTDLQDLLLLDPIHQVDDKSGWPVAAPLKAT